MTDSTLRQLQEQRATASVTQYVLTYRAHRVGNMALSLTNWGHFGNSRRIACCDLCTRRPVESLEFPIGSGIDYLAEGGVWVGAIKGTDTLVSTGTDGWAAPTEFFPKPGPDGGIAERTNRPVLHPDGNWRCSDVYFSADAVSEQDFITYYYDTVTSAQFVREDPWDFRVHHPLGVEIRQQTYAWSYEYADDFILADLSLRNISDDLLRQVYVGIFMDPDVGHFRYSPDLNEDDITGFIHTQPSATVPGFLDTLDLAWAADNNGDPALGRFGQVSATGVVGVRVIKAPAPNLELSFNWWASSTYIPLDWGPNKRNTNVVYLRNNLGTPVGDVARYQMLANGERDYDLIEAAIDHQAEGWLPPSNFRSLAADLADGYDIRYLVSLGPFDLPPGSDKDLVFAFVAGADLHTDARHFSRFFDAGHPEIFKNGLDFGPLIRNARWAGWVYDTPGYDTDGDGNRGAYRMVGRDTVYITGDGVPDFKGPPPPPAPELRFETSRGSILMRWNGRKSETTRDFFSDVLDFEGYRIYMSRTGRLEDFALLAQRDKIDWVRYHYLPSTDRWVVRDRPLTLDSLQSLYNDLVDSVYHFKPFHPDSFSVRSVDRAMMEVTFDHSGASAFDTNFYYFARYDANDKVDDTAVAIQVECCGEDLRGIIRKRYPFASPSDTVYEEGRAYPAYYEYEYVIDGLQLAEPVFLAVTAFDFGDPSASLSSLESSPLANAETIWPVNSAEVVKTTRPRPSVYPNPYRLADDYNGAGWEDPGRQGLDPERARRMTFMDVPDTCTISIWSLDGDLVRRLDHAAHPSSSQASVVVWNLITRNTQAVKTGIYIYTIESRFGTDTGKLVIIK